MKLGPFDANSIVCGDAVEIMASFPDACVDAIVTDPPYGLEFMSRSWDTFRGREFDPAFGHWFAGFVDGEGCFHIHKGTKNTYACQFTISLRADDMPILERCQRVLGIGTLHLRERKAPQNDQARWAVTSQADCLALRELLRAFPLRAKKAIDFEIWSDALDKWLKHEYGDDWRPLREAKKQLSSTKEYRGKGIRIDPYQMWAWRWATEAYRILKPGAYALIMGGSRTYHRLGVGLEDAGFELKDCVVWVQAAGFPKNHSVSKALDRKAFKEWLAIIEHGLTKAQERKVISAAVGGAYSGLPDLDGAKRTAGHAGTQFEVDRPWLEAKRAGKASEGARLLVSLIERFWVPLADGKRHSAWESIVGEHGGCDMNFPPGVRVKIGKYQLPDGGEWNLQQAENPDVPHSEPTFTASGTRTLGITDASTPMAKYWQGYGSALKPAAEFIWLCKKPNEGTYVDNVLEHRCGAMNINGCRVEYQSEDDRKSSRIGFKGAILPPGKGWNPNEVDRTPYEPSTGRWPANVLVDYYPEEFIGGVVIEGEAQLHHGGPIRAKSSIGDGNIYRGGGPGLRREPNEDDKGDGLLGSYTRFFIIPKPSKKEKNKGCMDLYYRREKGRHIRIDREEWEELIAEEKRVKEETGKHKALQARGNIHVTVKPVRLGKWLIKLITPHQHPVVVLDPFCGSGTFLVSAKELNEREGYQISYLGIDKDEQSVKTTEARLKPGGTKEQPLLL